MCLHTVALLASHYSCTSGNVASEGDGAGSGLPLWVGQQLPHKGIPTGVNAAGLLIINTQDVEGYMPRRMAALQFHHFLLLQFLKNHGRVSMGMEKHPQARIQQHLLSSVMGENAALNQ